MGGRSPEAELAVVDGEAITDPPPGADPSAGPVRSGVRRAVRSSNRPTPKRPPPPVGNYLHDLDRGGGGRARRDVDAEVEIYGHWFFGRLVAFEEGALVVQGVHPFMDLRGVPSRLRLVFSHREREETSAAVAVVWADYDEARGRARFTLVDGAEMEPLLDFARSHR